jgi:hemolysin activation/secretion protein
VDDIKFEVSDLVVDNATVYNKDELAPLIDPILHREITIRDVLGVADAIEAKYRGDGYVLTHVFVPPQSIGDSAFHLQVVEGFIKRVTVEGGGDGVREVVERAVAPVAVDRPASLATLERAILLANDLPGVTATGVIKPGDELGAADLIVTIAQHSLDGLASINNRGSPYNGKWTGFGEVAFNDLIGEAERITVDLSSSADVEQQRYIALGYTQPVGWAGFNLGFDASYSNGTPGYTLASENGTTLAYRLGPRASYSIIRSRRENFEIDGALIAAGVESDIHGVQASRDDYRMMEVKAVYSVVGWLGGASSISGTLDHGVDIFGASNAGSPSVSRNGAVPDFTKLSTEFRHLQPIGGNFSLSLDAMAQGSFDTLYSAEGFTLGGPKIGRGYAPAELIGDQGVGAATEIRFDQPVDLYELQSYEPYLFYDVGRVWQNRSINALNSEGVPSGMGLASAGTGLRLSFDEGVTMGFELARPLTHPPSTDQDRKKPLEVYFDLAARF